MDNEAVDTTSIREGILFYQDADGNTGYYWDSEVGICAPSLIPTESELWKDQEISDLLIIEKIESAESLVEPVEKMSLYPSSIPESPSSTLIEPVRNLSLNDSSLNNQESLYYDSSNFNLYRQESYLLTDFFTDSCHESFEDDPGGGNYEGNDERNYDRNYDRNYERNYERNYDRNYERNYDRNYEGSENDENDRINNNEFNNYGFNNGFNHGFNNEFNNGFNNGFNNLNDTNDVTMEERKFDDINDIEPPSPTSTRDPESDSQSEAIAWEYLQHFVGREFQDEAGLDYGENPGGKVWDDDEGMDPSENQ
ncbi:28124_t:CDS:2 [Racocetra persica]|uniref:28124_t:CDS:1 n=1 Tax=Racocetra persica TaxID=160502 RepID=A0ACA9MAQ5_9GLOM|nr:28124_t:CDS:2 [Racocetra persica]